MLGSPSSGLPAPQPLQDTCQLWPQSDSSFWPQSDSSFFPKCSTCLQPGSSISPFPAMENSSPFLPCRILGIWQASYFVLLCLLILSLPLQDGSVTADTTFSKTLRVSHVCHGGTTLLDKSPSTGLCWTGPSILHSY